MQARFWLILSFYLLSFLCSGQKTLLNPGISIKDFSLKQWTTQHGLSSNNITSVFQSAEGLLWITSFNGVMVFDGEHLSIYDRNNLPILDTDGFYTVKEGPDGSIYLGSQGSGLIRYYKGVFENYQPRSGKLSKSIRSLYFDKSETLYLGSINAGLFKLQNDTIIQLNHPILNSVTVLSIIQDNSGQLWAGTDGQGLFLIGPESIRQFKREDGLLSNYVASLSLTQEGNLLVGTSKGLQRYENNQFITYPELENSDVNALWVDSWNTIWVGLQDGIARLTEKQNAVEWLQTKNNVDLVRVTSIIQDKEQNLWFTTNRSGLLQLRETNITNLTLPALPSNRVYSLHESPGGQLYIGTDKNELTICSDYTCKSIPIKTNLGGNGIRDIYFENDQSIWLATYSGIIHLLNGQELVYATKQGMPADDFRTITKDRNGNFWFGSRSGGLVQFRDGKIARVYSNQNGLSSNYVLAVTESPSGDIYVGTHSGGMTIIKPNGTTKTYHAKVDDAGLLFFNIRIDDQGKVWVIANTGPIYFDGDSLRFIPIQFDRLSKTYFDWVEGDQGFVWISTNVGVLHFAKDDLHAFTEGRLDQVPFHLLDEEDGMNNKECTGATRSIKSLHGKIYIPTLGGVCIINPEDQQQEIEIPTIHIGQFKTDDLLHNPYSERMLIAPGTLRYSFRFSVVSFSAPARNQYRYRLSGLEKEWSSVKQDGEVEYTNLSPGTYTFQVIGCNDKNIWNTSGASITFTVMPFFYQTIWFYLLLVFFLALTLYLVHRWRLAFIKKQNQALQKVNSELDRFVYSASHDLRSPLSSILGLINVARTDPHTDKMEYFNMIEKSVVKLDLFIRDIINFSRNTRLDISSEKISFEKILDDVLEDLKFLEHFADLEKTITNNTTKDFYSDDKRLRIILSNLIANAIKHHLPKQREHPFIKIEITDYAKGVLIKVSDNGPGIHPDHIKDIFKMFFRANSRIPGSGLGLYIVQEVVTKLKGSIQVKSELGNGATFSILLPSLK